MHNDPEFEMNLNRSGDWILILKIFEYLNAQVIRFKLLIMVEYNHFLLFILNKWISFDLQVKWIQLVWPWEIHPIRFHPVFIRIPGEWGSSLDMLGLFTQCGVHSGCGWWCGLCGGCGWWCGPCGRFRCRGVIVEIQMMRLEFPYSGVGGQW